MPHPVRLLALFATLTLHAVAQDALPADWIDPKTGHRVIRFSPDTGGGSLYFHQVHSPRVKGRAVTHTYAVEIAKSDQKS